MDNKAKYWQNSSFSKENENEEINKVKLGCYLSKNENIKRNKNRSVNPQKKKKQQSPKSIFLKRYFLNNYEIQNRPIPAKIKDWVKSIPVAQRCSTPWNITQDIIAKDKGKETKFDQWLKSGSERKSKTIRSLKSSGKNPQGETDKIKDEEFNNIITDLHNNSNNLSPRSYYKTTAIKLCKVLPNLLSRDSKNSQLINIIKCTIENLIQRNERNPSEQSESEIKDKNVQLFQQVEELNKKNDLLTKEHINNVNKNKELSELVESQKLTIQEHSQANTQLQNQIRKHQSQILKLTTEIQEINNKNTSLREKIKKLKSELEDQKKKESTLMNLINKSFGKDMKNMPAKLLEVGHRKIKIPRLDLTKINIPDPSSKSNSKENFSEGHESNTNYENDLSNSKHKCDKFISLYDVNKNDSDDLIDSELNQDR